MPDWRASRRCWRKRRGAALAPDADALSVLAEFGGFEIAMMSGAMLAAAERGLLLLIDGFIVTSALLVAARLAPAIRDYCVFCHRSAEPGHLAQLRALHANRCSISACASAKDRRRARLAAGARRCRFPQRDGQLRVSRRQRNPDQLARTLPRSLSNQSKQFKQYSRLVPSPSTHMEQTC